MTYTNENTSIEHYYELFQEATGLEATYKRGKKVKEYKQFKDWLWKNYPKVAKTYQREEGWK